MPADLLAFPWDLDMLPFVAFEDRAILPACPGVYFVMADTTALYIGASNNLLRRVSFHEHHAVFVDYHASDIRWMPCGQAVKSRTILARWESHCLAHWRPPLNVFCGKGNPQNKDSPTSRAHAMRRYDLIVRYAVIKGKDQWQAVRWQPASLGGCSHAVEASSLNEARGLAIAACQAHQKEPTHA